MIRKYLQNFFDTLYELVLILDQKIWLKMFLGFIFTVLSLFLFGLGVELFLTFILVIVGWFWPSFLIKFLLVFIPLKAILKDIPLNGDFISIIIPISLGVLFFSLLRSKKYIVNNIDILVFLIFIVGIISSIEYFLNYGFRIYTLLDFLVWAQLYLIFLIGRIFSKEILERTINFNVIILNCISLVAIVEFFVIKNTPYFVESYELIKGRANGTLENPNALAGYILVSAFVFLYNQAKKRELRSLILLLLPLTAFLLTFSRGALIVLVALTFLFMVIEKKFKALGVSLVILVLGFAFSPLSFQKRILNISNPEHLSFSRDSGRLWALNNVLYINQNHLLFGNGWGSYGGEFAYSKGSPTYLEGVQGGVVGVGNTDNQWLQVYAQLGVIGLVLFFMVFKEMLIFTGKNTLLYFFLGYITLAFFIDIFQFYQISLLFWLYTGHFLENDKKI